MTSTTIFLYTEEKAAGTAIEWKDVGSNHFFYGGQGQKTAPPSDAALNTTEIKSIKNETGYILVWVKNDSVGPILGSLDKVDFKGVSYLIVLPNTTCSNTAQNWAIGLGVALIVMFIIIVALFMSGVVVFHGEGGAAFGYNPR